MLATKYVPFIKGKSNDIKSLKFLSSSDWNKINPLIELIPTDASTPAGVDAHLDKFLEYLSALPAEGSVYIDMYGFLPEDTVSSGNDAVIEGFERLLNHNINVTPVYGFSRDERLWAKLNKVISKHGNGVCIRLIEDELRYNPEKTWQNIIEVTSILGLTPGEVDIAVDFRAISKSTEYYKDLVLDFLLINKNSNLYRTVIISGSSALSTVTDVEKDGELDVYRSELELWLDLYTDVDDSFSLAYGDYGVVHPEFLSGGGVFINMNAKIRYTDNTSIVYYRGHGLYRPKSDFQQYHNIAKRVVQSSCFQNASFSYGDDYLFERANNSLAGTGSPATWVLSDMNHHIALVARQISNIHNSYNSLPDLTAKKLMTVGA